MGLEHLFLENVGCTQSHEVNSDSLNQCPLCELVNDDEDGIVST